MNTFFKKITKPIITNFFIIFFFIVLIELIFGYWFDKDNLGYYMREHRMKNQPTIFNYQGKSYKYSYKRNYYGFRGEDVEPANIEAIIMGGSVIDERYKPEEFTITGYLNKNLKKHKYNINIINAGIEGQSTVGMIYNFKVWFSKLKNFSPKIILLYVGLNDLGISEDWIPVKNILDGDGDGHVINPEKFERIKDNIKSRSFILDSVRIFKFKYLPRKNFVKYDGNIPPELENDFKYISYESAKEKYDIETLKKKYKEKISIYLSRIDILYDGARKLNSNPIFITYAGPLGHTEPLFMFNYSLISHCKIKKYHCIDMASKLKGKYVYWGGSAHTTKEGSEEIANLITGDLLNLINN